jgi:hypothetical protein
MPPRSEIGNIYTSYDVLHGLRGLGATSCADSLATCRARLASEMNVATVYHRALLQCQATLHPAAQSIAPVRGLGSGYNLLPYHNEVGRLGATDPAAPVDYTKWYFGGGGAVLGLVAGWLLFRKRR